MATLLNKSGEVIATIKWQYPKGTCPMCGYLPFQTRTHDCGVVGQRITWKD